LIPQKNTIMKLSLSSSIVVSFLLAQQQVDARSLTEAEAQAKAASFVKTSSVPASSTGRLGQPVKKKTNAKKPPPGGRTIHNSDGTTTVVGEDGKVHKLGDASGERVGVGVVSGGTVNAPVHSGGGGGNQNFDTHIVGGSASNEGDFPYFVDMNTIGCGGSLIAPRVVLTAAHCGPDGDEYENTNVIVGAFRNHANSPLNDGVSALVVTQVPHPNFNGSTLRNDFMLLRLEEAVDVDAPRLVISSDKGDNSPSEGTVLTVIGVGTTSSGGSQATSLRQVDVPVVDVDDCDDLYSGGIDKDVMFCAGTLCYVMLLF
jgi:hypothetical protein